jgi:sugar (pentulose or hexulose) kinase
VRRATLTYDLGTTRLKVALFAPSGRLLGQRAARHVEHGRDDRQWQAADQWWSDAVRLTRELLSHKLLSHKAVTIEAISLSGRGGAAVFVGADGTVVGDPWSDTRHRAELESLAAWRRANGVDLSSYAAALLAKKQWFVANEPQKARGLRHVLYAKDFLMFRLTGAAVTDWTSGPDGPTWETRALEQTQTSEALLPRPALPWEIGGHVTASAARALGVPAGTPVVVGGHDGICANVGAAAGHPGAYAITLGTHAVVRAIQSTHPPGAFRFYGLPPGRHVIGGNGLMGGRAADWMLDLVYGANDRARARHFREMDSAAAAVAPGADGVRFLPFLAGQVAPERRPGARAAFVGLAARHGRDVLYRAVLEGTAFAIRDIFAQIREWCGAPASVRLTGSGAKSAVWCDILAQCIGEPLEVSDEAVEGRGAAIFAAVALGRFADYDAAGAAMVPVRGRYPPDRVSRDVYDTQYRAWRAAVDATRVLDG